MSSMYTATFYIETDDEIISTGRKEIYFSTNRIKAVAMALYTHQLHAGGTSASQFGVISCPKCGKFTITG